MPSEKVEMKRKGKVIASRLMVQPSKLMVIEDYENARNSVGEWFSQIGLVRRYSETLKFRLGKNICIRLQK